MTPPNALIGSQENASLKLVSLFLFIETPHGFVCFMITVPLFFGKELETSIAEKISL